MRFLPRSFPAAGALVAGALVVVAGTAAWPSAPACAARAELPRGAWSVGAHGGYALVAMEDLNRALGQPPPAPQFSDELKHAWEGTLDVRYGLPDEFFLGLEAGWLRGAVTSEAPALQEVEVTGVPVQLVAGKALALPSETVVRVLAGAGAVVAGRLEAGGSQSYSGAGFLASIGGELEYRLAPAWALTAQALARQAKVKEPGGLGYDLDFTGAIFRAGVRGYFGGRRP
jgi:hypothetical protein